MVITVDGIDYAFRWIPAGKFIMGAPFSEGKAMDETQHKVKLTHGFWMLETEVTQAMWESIMHYNPSWHEGDNLPVERVSWHACNIFCNRLSKKLDGTVKLPTEAQWEYACRAGTTEEYAGELYSMACYNTTLGTDPVGIHTPNNWGLYDMHGNVWEWCFDLYDSYENLPSKDPIGPNYGRNRVSRGGGWGSNNDYCRSATRASNDPNVQNYYLGFRPIMISN